MNLSNYHWSTRRLYRIAARVAFAAVVFVSGLAHVRVAAAQPGGQAGKQALPPDSAAEHATQHASSSMRAMYTKKFDLSKLPHYRPMQQVSGTLRIWGNNYIGDSGLAKKWQDAFNHYQPNVKFAFNLPSAAIAIPSLYFGLADIGMNHEPTFYDYLAHVRIKGYPPTGVSVVTGSYDVAGWQNSIVIVVQKSNPLTKITMKELDGVFGSVRDGGWVGEVWHPEFTRGADQDIRTWGQLGLTGDWTNKRINVYGYTPRYATALEFSNKVLQGSDKWNGDLRAFGNWRRPDGTIYGQDKQIIDHLRKDPDGMAIVRYTRNFPTDLRVLAIAKTKAGPYIDYTIDSVQNRTYPLWGDQSFWVSVKPGTEMKPTIKEFLRFVLSREGQELVMKDGKYLPLTAQVAEEESTKIR